MASGILGRFLSDGANQQDTAVYTVPANTRTIFSVTIVNLGAADALCEMFLKDPGDGGDLLPLQTVFKRDIVVGETFSTVSLSLGAGQSIQFRTDQSDVVFCANGVEIAVSV